MDVSPEVEALAHRYHCEPDDPVFGILEAVVGKMNELRDLMPSGVNAEALKESLRSEKVELGKLLEAVGAAIESFAGENEKAEVLENKLPRDFLLPGRFAYGRNSPLVSWGCLAQCFSCAEAWSGTPARRCPLS